MVDNHFGTIGQRGGGGIHLLQIRRTWKSDPRCYILYRPLWKTHFVTISSFLCVFCGVCCSLIWLMSRVFVIGSHTAKLPSGSTRFGSHWDLHVCMYFSLLHFKSCRSHEHSCVGTSREKLKHFYFLFFFEVSIFLLSLRLTFHVFFLVLLLLLLLLMFLLSF